MYECWYIVRARLYIEIKISEYNEPLAQTILTLMVCIPRKPNKVRRKHWFNKNLNQLIIIIFKSAQPRMYWRTKPISSLDLALGGHTNSGLNSQESKINLSIICLAVHPHYINNSFPSLNFRLAETCISRRHIYHFDEKILIDTSSPPLAIPYQLGKAYKYI